MTRFPVSSDLVKKTSHMGSEYGCPFLFHVKHNNTPIWNYSDVSRGTFHRKTTSINMNYFNVSRETRLMYMYIN